MLRVRSGQMSQPEFVEPTPAAKKRLTMDYRNLISDPLPMIIAHPLSSNILEWHYVVSGASGTPYEGGWYHGKLLFPPDFPFRPPSIYMITPSGRFQTNKRLCLTISDYHVESWNPSWTVSTILLGLVSFMNDNDTTHMGGVKSTDADKRDLAVKSREFNLADPQFCDIFSDIVSLLQAENSTEASADDEEDNLSDISE